MTYALWILELEHICGQPKIREKHEPLILYSRRYPTFKTLRIVQAYLN